MDDIRIVDVTCTLCAIQAFYTKYCLLVGLAILRGEEQSGRAVQWQGCCYFRCTMRRPSSVPSHVVS